MNRYHYSNSRKRLPKRVYAKAKISKRLYWMAVGENYLNTFKDLVWNLLLPNRFHWPRSIKWHLKMESELKRFLNE